MTKIPDNTFKGCAALEAIVIPDHITEVGNSAFANCKVLANVTFSATMTAIPERMFENCDALTAIELPAGIKSVGRYAFSECDELTTFIFNEGLETVGTGLFMNSGSLKEVKFSSTMTAISESMFDGCKGLQKTLGEGDEGFVIPANIKSIGDYAFRNCVARNFKTVTFNEGLETIGKNAFDGCTKLTAIDLPSTVKEIGDEAFSGCAAVKEFDLVVADNVTLGKDIFKGTKKLETITVKAGSVAETYANAWVAADKAEGTFSNKLAVKVAE
jgi:hypothetical protein